MYEIPYKLLKQLRIARKDRLKREEEEANKQAKSKQSANIRNQILSNLEDM